MHPVVIVAIVLAAALVFIKFKLQWALNKELGLLSPEQQSAWFQHRKPSRKMLGLLFLVALVIVMAMYFIIPPSVIGGALAYIVFLVAVVIYSWMERRRLLGFIKTEQFPESFQQAATRAKNLEVGVLTVLLVLMVTFFLNAPERP